MTPPNVLHDWVQHHIGNEWFWYVKRLSNNDTGRNRTHQAGPYIPLRVIHPLFPSLASAVSLNPRKDISLQLDSHGQTVRAEVIWYNNKIVEWGTRNEARITNLGGSYSPLLDPSATGALCVFAFKKLLPHDTRVVSAWLCSSAAEESQLEGAFSRKVGIVRTS
jgi:hypothetical protein